MSQLISDLDKLPLSNLCQPRSRAGKLLFVKMLHTILLLITLLFGCSSGKQADAPTYTSRNSTTTLGSITAPSTTVTSTTMATHTTEDVYYNDCGDVQNAGVDPIHRGDPGYDSHLDRDGDGIGCE